MADSKKTTASKSAAKKPAAKKKTASTAKKKTPTKAVAKTSAQTSNDSDFAAQARDKAEFAKEKAGDYANDAKMRTGEAVRNLGQIIADTANVIDENLGSKYGDYARTAGEKFNEFGDKIEEKDLSELGDDTREFVRKSPAVAIGIAAVAGFMLTRMFKSGSNKS